MPAQRLRLPTSALQDTRGFTKRSSRLFVVRFKANQLSHPRFAIIVSVKVDRSSVGRHRLKRRATERLRSRLGGWDMIVTVLPAAKDLPRKEFLQELDRLLP